jgi:hypothetical protein
MMHSCPRCCCRTIRNRLRTRLDKAVLCCGSRRTRGRTRCRRQATSLLRHPHQLQAVVLHPSLPASQPLLTEAMRQTHLDKEGVAALTVSVLCVPLPSGTWTCAVARFQPSGVTKATNITIGTHTCPCFTELRTAARRTALLLSSSMRCCVIAVTCHPSYYSACDCGRVRTCA